MEKRIQLILGIDTDFFIEDTGRLRNDKTHRWLKGGINKGYHFYNLYWRGKQYILYTHRIVAQYFIPNPNNLPIVHHIDGNRLNNNYLNLQWVSEKDHNATMPKQSEKRGPQNRIDIDKFEDLIKRAKQFRNSPYYATEDGQIINTEKKIIIKPSKTGNYYRFQGAYNLNHKKFLIHRVVWEAFNGPIPEGYDIDHIDGNPANNALSNLQAISHRENICRREMDYSHMAKNNPNYKG